MANRGGQGLHIQREQTEGQTLRVRPSGKAELLLMLISIGCD
jgi:hypothetical protein